MDVRATVEGLAGMGVRVHCLTLGGIDLTSVAGKMTMQVLAAVAEFERDLFIERTNAGVARARFEGKALGRPSALKPSQAEQVRARIAAGYPIAAIARDFDTAGRPSCGSARPCLKGPELQCGATGCPACSRR